MAEGIIISINPVKEVGGLKLGPEFCEVLIEKAIKPRQYLVRRHQGAITVGEAINKCVAWRFVDVLYINLASYFCLIFNAQQYPHAAKSTPFLVYRLRGDKWMII